MKDENSGCGYAKFFKLSDDEQKRRDCIRRAHMSLAYEYPITKELDENRPAGAEKRWCHFAINEDGSKELVQIDPPATRCLGKARGIGEREETQEEVPCTKIKVRKVMKAEGAENAFRKFERLAKEGRDPFIEGPIKGSSSFEMFGSWTSREFGQWLIEYDCHLEEFPGESLIELLDEPTIRFVFSPEGKLIDFIVPPRYMVEKEKVKIYEHESIITVSNGEKTIGLKVGDKISEAEMSFIEEVLPEAKKNLLAVVQKWYNKSSPFKGKIKVLEA